MRTLSIVPSLLCIRILDIHGIFRGFKWIKLRLFSLRDGKKNCGNTPHGNVLNSKFRSISKD